MTNPIICAIDTTDLSKVHDLCTQLSSSVGAVKLGLEFFSTHGPQGIADIKKHSIPIFLDLKFHDIPNTVAKAVAGATALGVDMITIHGLGGKTMMEAAKKAAEESAANHQVKESLLLAVTVLTSMDEQDLHHIGIEASPIDQVVRLASLAKASGLHGCVCSAHEIAAIKDACGQDFVTVVPGIRLDVSNSHDQKRVMTPKQALDEGADYLVIGRAITAAVNPIEAVQTLNTQIESGT